MAQKRVQYLKSSIGKENTNKICGPQVLTFWAKCSCKFQSDYKGLFSLPRKVNAGATVGNYDLEDRRDFEFSQATGIFTMRIL